VLLGALDARSRALRFAGSPETSGGRFTMLRIGGLGAVAGGVLWATGFVGGNVDSRNVAAWFVVATAGSLAILLALIGLSAFQARKHPRLAWAAFVFPAAGTLVSIVGMAGMVWRPSDLPMVLGLAPWEIWILGLLALVVGSILFAVATLQAEVLSKRAAIALAATAGAFLVLAMLGFGFDDASQNEGLLIVACVLAFGGSWTWLGVSALRRGPIQAIAPA
jgi:hypothetical protein